METSLILYDNSFNGGHRKLMETCELLKNIKLNLIHTYNASKLSLMKSLAGVF